MDKKAGHRQQSVVSPTFRRPTPPTARYRIESYIVAPQSASFHPNPIPIPISVLVLIVISPSLPVSETASSHPSSTHRLVNIRRKIHIPAPFPVTDLYTVPAPAPCVALTAMRTARAPHPGASRRRRPLRPPCRAPGRSRAWDRPTRA